MCSYYSSQGDLPNPIEGQLDAVFDSLKGSTLTLDVLHALLNYDIDSNDEKDTLELESTMRYLSNDLKINLENAELFVAAELVQAPSIGEITRRGFLDGWKRTG